MKFASSFVILQFANLVGVGYWRGDGERESGEEERRHLRYRIKKSRSYIL